MTFDPEIEAALLNMTRMLKDRVPGIGAVLDAAVLNGTPVEDVMRDLLNLVTTTPGVADQVEDVASEAFAALRAEDVVGPLGFVRAREGRMGNLRWLKKDRLKERRVVSTRRALPRTQEKE